jgi:predicted TIM-barrel fold metal-dependent hydrolase
MLIADSQVHLWGANTPERPWPKRQAPHREVALGMDEMLAAMDAAGVDRVIIVPPGWEGDRNDIGLAAAAAHPDRFAVMGRLDPEQPGAIEQLAGWRRQPGMLGIRLTFHTEWLLPLLTNGKLDAFWPAAERAGVPVMVLVPHQLLHILEPTIARHPGLRFAMDHLSIPTKTRGAEAFAGLDHLLALAKYPNLAVKASSMPGYSVEDYPHRDIHLHLRRVYDAFGPQRMFWGSDYSRLRGSYRQAVTLFTEELPWLTTEDKAWIMGRGLCEWLAWPLPAAK